MIFDQFVRIDAPVERVWEFALDLPGLATCIPGVEDMQAVDHENYTGALKVRIGPISLRFQGRVRVIERDGDAYRTRVEFEATDKRVSGAVSGRTTVQLEPDGVAATSISIHTDVTVLGKLGDFGQPVMQRKASQILDEFARNLTLQLRREQVR
jgi:carbon monoxide dehydrogenase subunit G